MLDYLKQLAIQQLSALDDGVRIVVIHPNYVEQHLLLTEFSQMPVVYIRFDGDRLTRSELDKQLQTALAEQTEDGKSLKGLDTLILDECDRAIHDDLSAFLNEITRGEYPARVVLFSRQIPLILLNEDRLRQRTAFIPGDTNFMLWDYSRREDDTHLLEVRAFGEGRVILDGRVIDAWDGMLPRSLFFYLVDRGMITRNEIFDTFWPNLPVREATNVFHVTKRKISEVLGLDLTTYWSGFYRISPRINLSYDVVLFSEVLQQSAIAPVDEVEALLSRAATLYQGDFLSAMDNGWVHNRRSELSQSYGEALASLAKTREDEGQFEHALGLYLRAVAHNRQREDLIGSIMGLYRQMNMHADALHVFGRFERELRSELGVEPAPHLQDLARSIRDDQARLS